MTLDLGLLYVLIASLPILASVLLMALQRYCRLWAGWLASGAVGLSAVLSLVGIVLHVMHVQSSRDQLQAVLPWTGSFTWLHLSYLGFENRGNLGYAADAPGMELRLGYHVDTLTTILFLLITLVALCIHLYAIRSLRRETKIDFYDVLAHVHRPGRSVWFFTIFSLFTGAMLHLVLADNLVQVFVCWELVGLCSYFLIGFYREQAAAKPAALKAFLMNRVGDAGFLVALAILWTCTGTLSLVTVREEVRDVFNNVVLEDGVPKTRINQLSVFDAIRTPARDTHDEAFTEKGAEAGMMCRVELIRPGSGRKKLELAEQGSLVVVWNQETLNGHFHKPDKQRFDVYDANRKGAHGKGLRTMPYWMLVAAGLGLFVGAVSKSAQFPLQTWLPDAMAGPTPVSALVHSATMVAAGVYLMARVFPILTCEVLLVMAYVGLFTAVYGALCALAQHDVKRLLAYSTMSQLGLMLTALGVGGWVMALFHLATHACCKALLFLGTGSACDACNYVQDLRKLGGLGRKMPVVAGLMLFACLSLAGLPFLPGWYSKDGMLSALFSFGSLRGVHVVLILGTLLVTGLSAAYLTRYYLLLFGGQTRNEAITGVAQDVRGMALWSMAVLAVLSLVIVWLPHPFSLQNGWMVRGLLQNEPAAVRDEGVLASSAEQLANGYFKSESWLRMATESMSLGPHSLSLGTALAVTVIGGWWMWRRIRQQQQDMPAKVQAFLESGWRWDALLHRLFVQPVLLAGRVLMLVDKKLWDGMIHFSVRGALLVARAEQRFDEQLVDGAVRQSARLTQFSGRMLRKVQSGSLQNYLLLLVVAAMVIGVCVVVVWNW